jgi:drug/metabolite transporter (DMT)-like permease
MTDIAISASDRAAFEAHDWSLFVSLSLIWGASFLFIAVGLEAFHPGLITWTRVGLGAAALAAFPAARTRIDRGDRPRLVALSIVWVGVPFTLFPLAEQHINSAVTGLLNGATPIFAGIFAGLLFGRVPRGPQRIGLAIGFIGVTLVSLGSAAEGGTAFLGVLMALAATICYGMAINLAGALQQRYGSVAVMAKMLMLATIWTAPFGLYGLTQSHFAARSAAATTVLGVIGTGLAFALMATLVGRVGGTRASFITYLIPAVALVLGVVFLADRVTAVALVGVALTIAGPILAARQEA